MTVILTGWYEKECGAIILDETGESLSDIVARLIKRDPEDFGHTDMEVNWGTLEDYEDVGSIIYKLLEEEL